MREWTLRKPWRATFAQKNRKTTNRNQNNQEAYYDFDLDKNLIEASFAYTYNLPPSIQYKMKHSDYMKMLIGLDPECILCRVIRARKDKSIAELNRATEWEKEQYFKWRTFKNSKENMIQKQKQIDEMFKNLFK